MACWNCCCCFTVRQAHVRVIESLGKFQGIRGPGCHTYNCLTEEALQPFSMKFQCIHCQVNSMTKDKVHVHVEVAVHFRVRTVDGASDLLAGSVMGEGVPKPSLSGVPAAAPLLTDEERSLTPSQLQTEFVRKACYTLSNAHAQLASWTESLVRGQVPEYTIDGVYAAREKIANELQAGLEAQVAPFGYTIHTVLVTNIMPSPDTKHSMNEVNRQRRIREAKRFEAEADAKALVLRAEAESEAQRQSGIGLAEQRKAVVHGLQESIEGFHSAVGGVDSKEVMMMLLMNQYFDTLKEIAEKSSTNSVFMPTANSATQGFLDANMQADAGRPSL